ncbi:MAG: polysaccharide deacetylase family protein [Anaerolineales bacterium]
MKFSPKLLTIFILFLFGCSNTAVPATPNSTPTKKSIYFYNTTVSLTFDDGDADNYIIRSALAENQLHATFYVVSGFTGTEGFMTEEQLRGLYADGNEIGGQQIRTTNHSPRG